MGRRQPGGVMRMLRALVTIAAMLVAGRTRLSAQTVVGTAVFPDSATPVQSAIVQATNARGSIVTSTLTGRHGEFTIRFASPGTYSLRLLRIGFRPTKGPTLSFAAGATDTVRIIFSGEPIALAAVNVRERETCRVNADTGLAVARVWEEARKAMLTTQLNGGGAPLYAEWIEYDRTTDSSARIVRQQQVRTSRNPTTHAFKSLSAATLDEKGYIVVDGDVVTYYAPDADALLSDAFVSGHCFHLEPSPNGSAGLIGVSFQPNRSHRDNRDIEGTLFVDRATAELRWLEFRYTNMPDAA
ncbi:MAG: carboxypeptidase-like regulatory domain-containing protein, partial [Gemmatimonadaceae bacterium]